jgi:hypothetical protein
MPRTKSSVQQAIASDTANDGFEPGHRVRVWWPPTEDEEKTSYAGMYWPVKVIAVDGARVKVEYDNGEEETVQSEHLQPANPPVDFGKEAVHLQVAIPSSVSFMVHSVGRQLWARPRSRPGTACVLKKALRCFMYKKFLCSETFAAHCVIIDSKVGQVVM